MKNQLSQICEDWLLLFPNLQRYKNGRKLILASKTIVYGLELRKIFEDVYRPEFICLNLLSEFNEFSLRKEFSLPRNPPADINHRYHSKYFHEVAKEIKENFPIITSSDPQPEDIIDSYRKMIDHDLSQGKNPLALMTSIIQQSIYYDLADVESAERNNLERYFNSLPLSTREHLKKTIQNEISVSRTNIEQNLIKNMQKAEWSSVTEPCVPVDRATARLR